MEQLDNAKIAEILEGLRPLRCWKVGLAYGSCVYFRMKDQVVSHLMDGSEILRGSCELHLYGDDWSIFLNSLCIAESDSINREIAESELQEQFMSKELRTITWSAEGAVVVEFEGGRTIRVEPFETSEDPEDDILALALPDGNFIRVDRAHGPHLLDGDEPLYPKG